MKAKCATASSVATFETKHAHAQLATDLPPANVSAVVIEMSCGESVSPLTAHLGLLLPNPRLIPPNDNNEIRADDKNNDNSVRTFNTATLPVDKIERTLTNHGGGIGDGGTSDVDGDGIDVIQDFRY